MRMHITMHACSNNSWFFFDQYQQFLVIVAHSHSMPSLALSNAGRCSSHVLFVEHVLSWPERRAFAGRHHEPLPSLREHLHHPPYIYAKSYVPLKAVRTSLRTWTDGMSSAAALVAKLTAELSATPRCGELNWVAFGATSVHGEDTDRRTAATAGDMTRVQRKMKNIQPAGLQPLEC